MKGPRQPDLIGTGVPLQIGSVSVIATAAHVLLGAGHASVLTFGVNKTVLLSGERRGFRHRKGKFVDVDLAVIVLSNEQRDELRQQVEFSYSIEYATVRPPTETAFYTLIGFPHSRNKVSPRLLTEAYAESAYFVTHKRVPLSAIKSDDKCDPVHFALAAPSRYVPAPGGISGGGVWWLHQSPDPAAAPTPRLVGIGIEYWRRPGAFVCTRIAQVDQMVRDLQARS